MKKFFTLILLSIIAFNAIHAEVSWKLSNDGTTLTISGTDMPDNYHPWENVCHQIKKVVIENGVTNIGNGAFYYCKECSSIPIPNTVKSIGEYAFGYCSSLTSITIPNSVTSIGNEAFYECSNLASIIIPNSVTSIGEYVFEYTKWYKDLPDGLVYAGSVLYNYKGTMPANTNIVVKEGIKTIRDRAFYDCSVLTSITIPNSVTSIGEVAFSGCSGLTSIIIPSSVTSIGDYAFYGCAGLTSIIVENGNKKYDSRDNCNAIIETKTNSLIKGCKKTIIPNTVTSIGYAAFYKCSDLTSITIPNSVKSIEDCAFSDCSGLTSITIPNSMTSIGEEAFMNCSGLTSATIGNSVESIGMGAFYRCSGIKEIYSWNTTPPRFGDKYVVRGGPRDPFDGMNTLHAKVFVPEGSGDAYRYAPYWMGFLNIYEMEYSPVLSEADPITISDNASTITMGYYKEKTLTYEREGNAISKDCYTSFCLPFAVNPVDAQFKAVYVSVGVALYNTETNTLRIGFYKSEEIIPAGTPFLAQLAVDDKVVIKNALPVNYNSNEPNVKKNVVHTFNYSDKEGLMSENNNYAINFSGTYKQISSTNTYKFNADGSVGLSANVSPFRAYISIAKNSTNAKIVTSFDEDTELTGIMDFIKPNVDLPVYDLNGRAVNEKTLKSGVYIKNGKKVVIK